MINRPTVRRWTHGVGLLLVAAAVGACSFGPVDQAQLCAEFAEFDAAVAGGNAGWGNPLFDAAGELGDMAARFDGQQPLYGDAAALTAIADSDSTDMNALRNASMHIADLCGRPPAGLGGPVG